MLFLNQEQSAHIGYMGEQLKIGTELKTRDLSWIAEMCINHSKHFDVKHIGSQGFGSSPSNFGITRGVAEESSLLRKRLFLERAGGDQHQHTCLYIPSGYD